MTASRVRFGVVQITQLRKTFRNNGQLILSLLFKNYNLLLIDQRPIKIYLNVSQSIINKFYFNVVLEFKKLHAHVNI